MTPWIDSDELVWKSLVISAAERERLQALEAQSLSVIRPVALPRGKHLVGVNTHLGWPVGIRIGDALLCAYHRTKHHHGPGTVADRRDADSSDAVVLRSLDGGETWSDPVDMRLFGTNGKRLALHVQNCFGVVDNTALLATRYGIYRSEDEGARWELLPDAMSREQTRDQCADVPYGEGPRMVHHPDKGLVIVKGVRDLPCMDVYNSVDKGRTWRHERVGLPEMIHPLEPTAIFHEGHLIFVTRNHPLPFRLCRQLNEPQRPAMMVSSTGWFPMEHMDITNIASHRWPDTTDVDYNPVTDRYEAVVTNRSGGGPETETNELNEKTLNLWSIARDELYAGKAQNWRFEATLLRWPHGSSDFRPDGIDSAHPGGAVIDTRRGMQHIFIHSGMYATPTGVYRISRTLETARLREACAALKGSMKMAG